MDSSSSNVGDRADSSSTQLKNNPSVVVVVEQSQGEAEVEAEASAVDARMSSNPSFLALKHLRAEACLYVFFLSLFDSLGAGGWRGVG